MYILITVYTFFTLHKKIIFIGYKLNNINDFYEYFS
jgi:glycerate-2-kinase